MCWNMIGAICGISTVVITAIGLLFVYCQIRAARLVAATDFLFRMENEYGDHFVDVYEKLTPNGDWEDKKSGPKNKKDIAKLEHYLAFLETLQLLRKQGHIGLEMIDRMFAYRFFIAVNNKHVNRLIKDKEAYWDLLTKLKEDWLKFRKKRNRQIP